VRRKEETGGGQHRPSWAWREGSLCDVQTLTGIQCCEGDFSACCNWIIFKRASTQVHRLLLGFPHQARSIAVLPSLILKNAPISRETGAKASLCESLSESESPPPHTDLLGSCWSPSKAPAFKAFYSWCPESMV
jgi:hypothetical protein